MSNARKDERDRSAGTTRPPEGPAHNLGFDDFPARAPDHVAGTPDWPGDGFQRPDDVHLAADLFAHQSDPAVVRETAAEGVATIPENFPFREELERAFGQPVLARAHTGPKAAAAARSMGARAFATGSDVAFRDKPDLRTAAHEAAHTLQQATGVDVAGGIGRPGDQHERTADRAADLVVAGKSASHLFSSRGPTAAPTTAVQMQKDASPDPAHDSATAVDQMLPLFGKDPTKWAQFVRGLPSTDGKTKMMQAIMKNPALGQQFGFDILKAIMGSPRDGFTNLLRRWGNAEDHALGRDINKHVLQPANREVIQPIAEVAEAKAKPVTDVIGTAKDIGRAVQAAYDKDGVMGVLAMPAVGMTHQLVAFRDAIATGDVRAIFKLIVSAGIDVAVGAAIGRVLEGVMAEMRLAGAARKAAKLATGVGEAEAEALSSTGGKTSGAPAGKESPAQPAGKGPATNTEATTEPSAPTTNRTPAEAGGAAPATSEPRPSTAPSSPGQAPGAEASPGATGSKGGSPEGTTTDAANPTHAKPPTNGPRDAPAPSASTEAQTVADYVSKNGRLPDRFVTKQQAKRMGWSPKKGNLDQVAPGKSIGGDPFSNNEGLLPAAPGRQWFEADLGYSGGTRGAARLLYSSDGLVFMTSDHYKTFTQVKGAR